MNILLTGGNGMVGKNIKEYFHDKPIRLLSPTRNELDLLDFREVDQYLVQKRPDLIIHCAGLVGGIQANIERPYSFLYQNSLIGLNLVHAAAQNGIQQFINLASSCMYPRNSNTALNEEDILKGELEPTNEGYALAKITTTRLCQSLYKEKGLNYKTIIPCNLFGKYDKFDPKNSHMIPAVIKKLHDLKDTDREAEIWGDGKTKREFMYAEDLSDFLWEAVQRYDELDSIMNVGLGYDFTIDEYYKTIAKVVGFKGRFTYNLDAPVGMKRKLVSIKKQQNFGWSPKHSLEEGINKTYKYYIENYGI